MSEPKTAVIHGESRAISGQDLSDEEVAGRVRMLMRDALDHEAVCVLARDRILYLSQRLAESEKTYVKANEMLMAASQMGKGASSVAKMVDSLKRMPVGLPDAPDMMLMAVARRDILVELLENVAVIFDDMSIALERDAEASQ